MRFPEFKGEWNFEPLDTIAPNITSGKSKSSVGQYDLYGSIGIIGKTQTADYSGDMLLVARVGANAGALQLVNGDCGITDNTLIIKPQKLSSHYLYFYLQHYNLNRLIFGSGQPLITAGMLKAVRIPFGNPLEQCKIEKLLNLIDERIVTQNKIIEDLKLLKKTMSQNIFSLKIRFKDEEGNVFSSWKLRKLSDVLIIQGGYAFKSSLFNQGTNKVIRIGDILPIIKLSNFSGIYSSETPNEKYIVRKNDFVMALSGATFGKVGKIEDKGIAYINQRVATFRTIQCLEFFYQLVQINNFKNYISSIPTASAQPNISNDDIGNYKSYIPDVIEQTKIAGFLSTIDKKIETERAILDAYAKQKQYLLANLLI